MKCFCVLSFLVVACSDQVSAPPGRTPLVPTTPTTPVAQPGPLAQWLIVSRPITRGSGTTAQSVAYVSLPSGHLTASDSVLITNVRTRSMVRPVENAGGFDPVAIDAALGDTLDVAVSATPAASVTHTLSVVAARTPLDLVRTDPANASDSVDVDASVLAVFSEPLDPAAASAGIHLSHIGQDVPSALTVDSSGTRVTLRPLAALASGEPYDVYIRPDLTGVTGATPAGAATVWFQTIASGDPTATSLVIGEWDATSWRFTDVNSSDIWEDPVVGWGPDAYYRLHLSVGSTGSGPPGSVLWRLTMTWKLGGTDTGSAELRGTATLSTSWWLGHTTQSPWLQYTTPCQEVDDCPLQNYQDFRRDGNTLTITRRDTTLLYLDGLSRRWPAREVLTLQRAMP